MKTRNLPRLTLRLAWRLHSILSGWMGNYNLHSDATPKPWTRAAAYHGREPVPSKLALNDERTFCLTPILDMDCPAVWNSQDGHDRVYANPMRLWSLHPSLLDPVGLVALWREGLLAQNVLLGRTTGYRFHPQLNRFRATNDPVAAISTYLWGVSEEAEARGYTFNTSKIARELNPISLFVTRGQLEFEWKHLCKKLRVRNPARHRSLTLAKLSPHPMLRVIPGAIEPWEVL